MATQLEMTLYLAPKGTPSCPGPRETTSASRSSATAVLHTPGRVARSGHPQWSVLAGLGTAGRAPLRSKNKLSLSGGGRM